MALRIFAIMNHEDLKARIAQISPLPEEDYALLLSSAEERKLKKGEVVLHEGEVCRSFYLVTQGHLRTWYNKNGVPINLNFTFEGDFTSNLQSFKSRKPSEFIIEAGEPSTVYTFNINVIEGKYKERPELTIFIRRLAVRLLLTSEEHSNIFKMYTPTERYHYIEKNNPALLQRVSLSQLASYLGVKRETLSRIRAKSS